MSASAARPGGSCCRLLRSACRSSTGPATARTSSSIEASAWTTIFDRHDRSWRTAPFILLTAPVGPVELSAVAAYVDLHSETDYDNAPVASDSGHVHATSASLNAKYWVTPKLEIGASVGWTDVVSQRVQAAALPLDSDWANVGLAMRYRLTDSLDVSASGSRDFANDGGNGARFGAGLAYRF
jgi:hypothetical protein